MSVDEQEAKLENIFLQYSVARHLRLYLHTRHGLLIWRAYAEYRQRGLPIPENLLAKLDIWADALERASTDKQVAEAVEMAAKKGRTARIRLRQAERNFDVMEHLNIRTDELSQKPGAAAKAVEAQFGLEAGHAKVIKSRWRTAKIIEQVNGPATTAADETVAPDPTLQSVWLQRSTK